MVALIERFDLSQILEPIQEPELARWDAVAMGPNLAVTKGMVLARKTADNLIYPYSASLANPVGFTAGANLIFPVTVTGLAAASYFVQATWVIPNGAETLPSNEVTTGALLANQGFTFVPPIAPVGATGYNIYVSTATGTETRQNGAVPIAVGTNWTIPATGLVAGAAKPGANGTAVADGTQTARGLAQKTFNTDASGKVFYGPTATPNVRTGPWSTAVMFKAGTFDPADLSLLDTNAVSNLGAKFLHQGFLLIPG